MATEDVITYRVGTFGVSSQPSFPFNDTECHLDSVPSMPEYFSAITTYGYILFTTGALAVILVILMYIDTLRYVYRDPPPGVKANTAFVLSVYPVVTMATYCAMVVPRSQLLAEAVTQGVFTAAFYELFGLFVAYCGGEAELIKRVKPNSLNTRVGPCCCWPCCCCLPLLHINKNHVRHLRLIILQLPVIQGLIYMILLVMWAEEENLYQVNYMYFQPIVIFSILFGIWGMMMTIKMLADILKNHFMIAKFIVLQLVLLLAKIQGFTIRFGVWSNLLPCRPPITPTVYGNLIYNSLVLVEMVLLSYAARRIYKRPLPDMGIAKDNNNSIQVCVISNGISTVGVPTIGRIMATSNDKTNNNDSKSNDLNKNEPENIRL